VLSRPASRFLSCSYGGRGGYGRGGFSAGGMRRGPGGAVTREASVNVTADWLLLEQVRRKTHARARARARGRKLTALCPRLCRTRRWSLASCRS
jgi:hypothetical protein